MALVRKTCLSSSLVLILVVLFFLVSGFPVKTQGDGLVVGFYNQTCPQAESLVQQTVAAAFANTSGAAAATLIRMHFHDCFVRGCDGSILIDSTANNTAEKDAPVNNPSLHRYEIIDTAKSAIEAVCPNIVSCADILAFAARDSIALAGNITYQVPAGRRDGTISIADEAENNLPSPHFNASQLIANFAAKNLTVENMVILSGAHTVGVAHCIAFVNRLYNFSSTSQVDPTLSGAYALLLQALCPSNVTHNDTRFAAMDIITPSVLDNKYYIGLTLTLGLLTSDQALLTQANLSAMVTFFANHENAWQYRFTSSMVKMGQIEVLTGNQGQIRTNCRMVNSGTSSKLGLNVGLDQYNEIAGH